MKKPLQPIPDNGDYKLYPEGRFVVRDYNRKKPFSNFLPGIAGFYGTPMWVFYVNRGQGIASFGTKNKDNAILEFFPANKAYQNTTQLGFRTFIKLKRPNMPVVYEPFRENRLSNPEQSMVVSSHELLIEEINRSLGLKIRLRYFTVPGEPIGALARELEITNLSSHPLDLEVLDGLPQVNPYGMNEFFVKSMSRTIEAWMVVDNLEKKAPFFRLRVDATDRPEVTVIPEGNFFFSVEDGRQPRLLETVVDPAAIFGSMLDFREPKVFYTLTPFSAPKDQVLENKTPCAFSVARFSLNPHKPKKIRSFYGQANNVDLLNRYVQRAKRSGYFEDKGQENWRLIESIKAPAFTATASNAYDLYCGQTYLDNIMRGGLPVCVGELGKGLVFHVYSRKHGDLERDYNRFLLEPSYFAQGDGNYRDVNQNRRNDVWFEPRVRDTNIKIFLNLIQLDGFNPLILKGATFSLKRSAETRVVLQKYFKKKDIVRLEGHTAGSFSLGEFYRFLEQEGLIRKTGFQELLKELAPYLTRQDNAEHGEGFWVDHWTYNLDLIESYLAIYPEDSRPLLFDRRDYGFYDNDRRVRPRHEKYYLKKENTVRQYQSVYRDKDKAALIENRLRDAHQVRARMGQGEVYRTTLFVKLAALFAVKFASLDAQGTGVEMEADKPSWYDALNGLPGLCGSSLCETFELKRLALFLIQSIDELETNLANKVDVPEEVYDFIGKLARLLEKHFSTQTSSRGPDERANFLFWDVACGAKEGFREKTAFGVSGRERKMTLAEFKAFLEHAREKIEMGLSKAYDAKSGLFPTYFENEVTEFQVLKPKAAPKNGKTRPPVFVRPTRFRQTPLPFFLEGPVHALKVEKDPSARKSLLRAVRSSRLYDTKLGMYKVNSPVKECSLEIGRARIFTPGWLENESIWLHMEYKFLLELLKGGLTEEFFADFKKALIPFQPPARYGRSVLENSSFIVSSVFPDASLHGGGFVARLSGSTAEFLTLWLLMNVGKKPFIHNRGKLSLRFQPTLPAFLFLKQDTVRTRFRADGSEEKLRFPKDSLGFMFLGKTLVVYHNTKGLDTFGKLRVSVRKITLTDRGRKIEFKGDTLPSPHAERVRDGFVPRIDIELG